MAFSFLIFFFFLSLTQVVRRWNDNTIMEKYKRWNKHSIRYLQKYKANFEIHCDEHTSRIQSQLPSQGFIISFLLEHSLKQLNSLWSKTQSKLPAYIFNFCIKYLNNTLATRKKPPFMGSFSNFWLFLLSSAWITPTYCCRLQNISRSRALSLAA